MPTWITRPLFALMLLLPLQLHAAEKVVLTTSDGDITIELDRAHAPKSVDNFLSYVREGFYDGLIFHRVIDGFMIQGGGMDAQMQPRETHAPIVNESDNGLSNQRGTIAMARTRDPDSATSQFFINTVNNLNLDGRPGRPGYTVFGKVIAGMDVVDKISKVETTTHYPYRDVPVTPVVIEKAKVVDSSAKPEK